MKQELLRRAHQIRDERTESANTAYRVGQLLADMIEQMSLDLSKLDAKTRYVDCGEWQPDRIYIGRDDQRDEVWYYGCRYRAQRDNVNSPPRYGNTSWLMVEGDPEFRAAIVEPEQLYDLANFHATATIRATLHHQDVTRYCAVSWTRYSETADGSPRTLSDELWARRFVEHGRDAMRLELTKADLDYPAGEPLRTIRFVAVVRLVEADNVYTNTLSIAF